MRFLVIGGQLIAQRRARLLTELGHNADCAELNVLHTRKWWRNWLATRPSERLRFAWAGTTDAGSYDAAFVCTPSYTRVQVALECLHVGVKGVFIEAPLGKSLAGVDELQERASGRQVMIGCSLRFGFNLPRYQWSLLEFISSRPYATRRTGADLANGRALSAGIAYPELDLAYAANGPVQRLDCITTVRQVRLRIEHENMAHTDIRVDACGKHGNKRLAVVSAWDDGAFVCVPHRPRLFKLVPDDRMLVDEMNHFTACLRNNETPCNTVTDAAYVLGLTLQTSVRANARA